VNSMNSLRTKIYFGFAVIVLLLIAVGLIGYSSAMRLQMSSAAMRDISAINSVVLGIDRDVQELQLRVGRYMTSGHDSLRDDVLNLNDRLLSIIEDATQEQTDPEMLEIFQRMSEHLPEYKTHFDSVFTERQVRSDLVQNQLPAQSVLIDNTLRELNAIVTNDTISQDIGVALLRCESLFATAEQLLLRYYVSNDSKFVTEALADLNAAVGSLNDVADHQASTALRQKLVEELKGYERISIRAVQATRSYLYLVNVVMAGEASEVSYYSNRLRTLSERRRDAISAEVASTVATVRKLTGLGIAFSLVLALLISGRLAVGILRPITALTATFRRLAAGETVVAIPEAQRTDEIGEMAAAARVFSDQNRQQRGLLATSETLRSELASKADELEKTNSDLDNFAYVASHDLKSPLRGIRQLASWIDEDSGHLLPEESVKHFRTMQSRVRRMELLLDDLLNYSRVGRTEAVPEDVDVPELLQDIADITDNPHGVSIRWPDDLPTFKTNRVPLEQVLMNLIGNAIKHNDKGSDGVVEVQCERVDDAYHFCVKDNGPGIDSLHHERVFQMYQRIGDNSVEGSGMGLAIVKKQVERVGGSIRVDSNHDIGVTFGFNWPSDLATSEESSVCPTAMPPF